MTPHPTHRRDDRPPAPGTGRATPTRMPRRAAAAASLLTLALVLGGCAPASQVILLPQTDGRPSAVEVRAATGTRVLVVGQGVNPALARRVAGDTGLALVTLYTGALSGPESPAATYLDFMRHNVRTLVEALKGAAP